MTRRIDLTKELIKGRKLADTRPSGHRWANPLQSHRGRTLGGGVNSDLLGCGGGAARLEWGWGLDVGVGVGCGGGDWMWGLVLDVGVGVGCGGWCWMWGWGLDVGVGVGCGGGDWMWGLVLDVGVDQWVYPHYIIIRYDLITTRFIKMTYHFYTSPRSP